MLEEEAAFKKATDKAIRLFLKDKKLRTYSGTPTVVLDFELYTDSDGWRCLNCLTPGCEEDFIRVPSSYCLLIFDRAHCNEFGWMMNLPQDIVIEFYNLCLEVYANL